MANYPEFRTFNYGQSIGQAENILASQERRNPNSLNNQYRQEQINALRDNAANPNGGLGMSPISGKDFTGASIKAAMDANDPSLLVPRPYKPKSYDTKTHRVFGDIDPVTRKWTETHREPINNFDASRDTELGTLDAQQGGIPSSGIGITGGQNTNMGLGGGNQPSMSNPPATNNQQPMQPVPSKATLEATSTTAKAEATEIVKYKVEKARMAKALKMYTGGAARLKDSLEKTITGPFVGQVWPVKAQAQVAEHAKAMMLPILKQIVRGPGEGVFTDADALAVLELIPDRIIDEDARDQIFANMDAMMKDFLTPINPFPPEEEAQREGDGDSGDGATQEGTTATNPSTGQKIIFRSGAWQPM